MISTEGTIQNLLEELEKLPGIGPKSASRIAYFLLNENKSDAVALSDAIRDVAESVHFCSECFNYAKGEKCEICESTARDHSLVCVVPEPRNIPPIERTGAFKGVYHVLGGELSPLDGIGPDDIRVKELIARVKKGGISEVIVATDPNIEGEATANFIADKLKGLNVNVTRPARGIPFGGELEFADEMTLAQAFDDRRGF
ncbi:recombination mediator RecR [Phoenicibacter congonensis]|uniref:recombination mediator RecR n=1 Tax=Phoenicibacter congonensis TaxID=1944646 RepID=UPI0009A7AB48|nr:recombination mediator RecR [Phoenicibacter congonensis]